NRSLSPNGSSTCCGSSSPRRGSDAISGGPEVRSHADCQIGRAGPKQLSQLGFREVVLQHAVAPSVSEATHLVRIASSGSGEQVAADAADVHTAGEVHDRPR